MMLTGIILFILVLAVPVWNYNIKYFDCSKPSHVIKYCMNDVCENEIKIKTKRKKTTRVLLQERQVEELQGYSCKIIKTTFLLYCGAWSHTKMAQMPKIEINQMLSVRECESLNNTGKYITLEGTTHQVSINRKRYSVSLKRA